MIQCRDINRNEDSRSSFSNKAYDQILHSIGIQSCTEGGSGVRDCTIYLVLIELDTYKKLDVPSVPVQVNEQTYFHLLRNLSVL